MQNLPTPRPAKASTKPSATSSQHLASRQPPDRVQEELRWQDCVVAVEPSSGLKLDLIGAGLQDGNYISRVQDLNWKALYEEHGLAQKLEDWRQQWKQSYDFVLIDSRTGVTDIGAVCTAYLPDILAVCFTANDQSIDGCVEVIDRATAARKKLVFDRSALHVLPIPCRFDAKEEYQRAEEWRVIFLAKTGRFLNSWLEQGVGAAGILNRATIPYVAYWSFGEGLPVVDELSRRTDTIRFSLETIAALLAHKLGNSPLLVESAESYVHAAVRSGSRIGGYNHDILLRATADLETRGQEVMLALTKRGFRVVHADHVTPIGSPSVEQADRAIDQAHHAVFLIGREFSAPFDADLRRFAKQLIDDQTDRVVLPVCFNSAAARGLPSLLQRSQVEVSPDITVDALADLIAVELQPSNRKAAIIPVDRPDVKLAQSKLDSTNPLARKAAVATLGQFGNWGHIETLAGRLDDDDERVRVEAKRAITELYKREQVARPGILPDMHSLIASGRVNTRFIAAELLARQGNLQAIYQLLSLLDETDPSIRKQAVKVIGEIGNPIAVDWLMAYAEDSDSDVRGSVIGALLRLGTLPKRTIVDLLKAVDNNNVSSFAQVFANITNFSAVGNILIDLADDYPSTGLLKHLIGETLETPASEQVERWISHILTKSPSHHFIKATDLLAEFPMLTSPIVVDSLFSRLTDLDDNVRSAAVQSLGRVGSPLILESLVSLGRDKSPQVRLAVVEALCRVGGPEAVNGLIQLLSDEDNNVRSAAVRGLGRIGTATVLKNLIPCFEDDSPQVLGAVVEALCQIGGPEAVNALIRRLSDEDKDVRSAAVRGLGIIGDASVLKDLIPCFEDDSPQVRGAVAETLGAVGGSAAVNTLITLLSDSNDGVRTSAILALGKIGDAEAVKVLIALLTDSKAGIRAAAINALGKIGGRDAVNPLIPLLSDHDVEVRRSTVKSLAELVKLECTVDPIV